MADIYLIKYSVKGIKAIADELLKDYADNQVTQMLSMGIVRKL